MDSDQNIYLTNYSKSYLDKASAKLIKLGTSRSWKYTIEASAPINFVPAPFYPEQWKTIRTEKRWLKLIHIAQLMCYSAYCQRMHNCLFDEPLQLTHKSQSESVLTALWASEWG